MARRSEVERAVEAVRAKDDRALAALAYDVLMRQAEGRALYAGQKLIQSRAEEHRVDREAAGTALGNVVAILERGPQSTAEHALIAAFAVAGFGHALEASKDDAKARAERVFRFVRHVDWLDVATDYSSVHAFVDPLLSAESAATVWNEVAQAIVDDAAGRDGELANVRARNAARLTALAASGSATARDALRNVVRSSALDEPTRHLASTLAGDGADAAPIGLRMAGRVGAVRRRGAVDVARWISGIALIHWLLRSVAFLLGVRHEAEVRLGAQAIDVTTRLSFLGRVVRERHETLKLDAVSRAAREVRYPMLHLLVGAIALSIGVLFGGLVLFDGARSGELVLFAIAALLILGGAGLDLALDVLVPGTRAQVRVELAAKDRRIAVTRVPIESADTFLRALRTRTGAA